MFLPSLALAKEVEMKVYDYKLTRVLDGEVGRQLEYRVGFIFCGLWFVVCGL